MIDSEYVSSTVSKLRGTLFRSRSISAVMKKNIEIVTGELISFELLLFSTEKLNDTGFADHISRIDATLKKNDFLLAIESGEFKEWDTLSSELLLNIRLLKLALMEKEPHCFPFFNFLSSCCCQFSTYELQRLVRTTSRCLHFFLVSNQIPDDKVEKMRSLMGDMSFLEKVLEFASRLAESHVEMENFKIQIQAWASDAACFSLLIWILYDKDGNASILPDFLKKLKFSFPKLTRMCLAFLVMVLEPDKISAELPLIVGVFVYFFLPKFQVDDFGEFKKGMKFFITFLMNHSDIKYANDGNLILTPLTAANEVDLIPSIELMSLMYHIPVFLSNFNGLEGDLIPDNKAIIKSLIGDMPFFQNDFPTVRKSPRDERSQDSNSSLDF